MDVRTCRRCGRLFNYLSGDDTCPVCRNKEEDAFKSVKDYLYEHKGAGFYEVKDALGIEGDLLRKWLREGRIEFARGTDSGIVCERCGKPISSGRFCEKCQAEMVGDLKSVYPEKANALAEKNIRAQQEEKERMRFLKNRQ